MRKGGLGVTNPYQEAAVEYAASTKISQRHELLDDSRIQTLKQIAWKEKNDAINEKAEVIDISTSQRTKRLLEFASKKGASTCLMLIPISDMGFNLNKCEFKDGLRLKYDWPFSDNQSKCICGESFNIDHEMICRRGGFIIQRHNELRDLEAKLLNIVCNDVHIEPALQDVDGKPLIQDQTNQLTPDLTPDLT